MHTRKVLLMSMTERIAGVYKNDNGHFTLKDVDRSVELRLNAN